MKKYDAEFQKANEEALKLAEKRRGLNNTLQEIVK
jgi:hypothetical protein